MCSSRPFLVNPQLLEAGWGSRPLHITVWSSLTEQSPAAWHFPSASVYPGGYKVEGGCGGINSHGGDISSDRLLLPKGPKVPISGPASKAPGCLGTFPNKCARVVSLSGKHGLPCSLPCHHYLCQLCSVGTLWGQCMAWESGHLGPEHTHEPQGLGQSSASSEAAIYLFIYLFVY